MGLWAQGQPLCGSEGLPRREELGAELRGGVLGTLHIPVHQAQPSSGQKAFGHPQWMEPKGANLEGGREGSRGVLGETPLPLSNVPAAAGGYTGARPACPCGLSICFPFPSSRIKGEAIMKNPSQATPAGGQSSGPSPWVGAALPPHQVSKRSQYQGAETVPRYPCDFSFSKSQCSVLRSGVSFTPSQAVTLQ